ncbi:MAG: type II toxin-antitoxin system VapC family toxin [Candidatus Symbiodolus clandestinus]
MKAVLLDTHVLVWLLEGSERLEATSRAIIQKASNNDALFVSAITSWEIAMLVSKKRLVFDRDIREWLQAALALPGIYLHPLSIEVAVASTCLPGDLHLDPADRIIVATARHLGATLVTADRQLLNFGALGHIKCLAADS